MNFVGTEWEILPRSRSRYTEGCQITFLHNIRNCDHDILSYISSQMSSLIIGEYLPDTK